MKTHCEDTKGIKFFISYAIEDESFKNDLEKHLGGLKNKGLIEIWHCRRIIPGLEWDREIRTQLKKSHIILFLVSPDFINSNYINTVEVQYAIELHKKREALIVPILIRPCDFESLKISRFQALPKNAKPISRWDDKDQAYLDVVKQLKKTIEKINELLPKFMNKPALSPEEKIPYKLLFLIWEYPYGDGIHNSWAVKESEILCGNLDIARKSPGLGIAIFSTQLAQEVFGRRADSRIDRCVQWALGRTQLKPPYQVLVEDKEPITSAIKTKPDFRHTICLGIILARTCKHLNHVKHYLDLVLEMQSQNGGWPPSNGVTVSEVFTVIYATEFLSICAELNSLSPQLSKEALKAARKGIQWLINTKDDNFLWSSGVMTDYLWDRIWTTSWILRRLAPLHKIVIEGWEDCLNESLHHMVRLARTPATWLKTNPTQRFRVEARITAGASLALRALQLNKFVEETVTEYLQDWNNRANATIKGLPDNELDLATSLFLVDSLIEPKRMKHWAKLVLEKSEI